MPHCTPNLLPIGPTPGPHSLRAQNHPKMTEVHLRPLPTPNCQLPTSSPKNRLLFLTKITQNHPFPPATNTPVKPP